MNVPFQLITITSKMQFSNFNVFLNGNPVNIIS